MGADVEFLVDEGAQAADEELPAAPRPGWLRIAVPVAAVGLVAGLVAARADTRAPTAERSSAPPQIGVPITGRVLGGPPRLSIEPRHFLDARPAYCPEGDDGAAICSTARIAPAPVVAALRTYAPGARVVSAVDEQLRDVGFGPGGIWYRRVAARAGSRTIVIEVRPARQGDEPVENAQDTGSRSTTYVARRFVDTTVLVEVRAPSGHAPSLGHVAALATDPRVRALQ